jgi:transposase InsO family protein
VNLGIMGGALASGVGLAAVLRASAPAFDVLKIAGAIHLAALGVQSLRVAWTRISQEPAAPPLALPPLSESLAFRRRVRSNSRIRRSPSCRGTRSRSPTTIVLATEAAHYRPSASIGAAPGSRRWGLASIPGRTDRCQPLIDAGGVLSCRCHECRERWAMAADMRTELVLEALEMAVQQRRPARRLIHHSVHGSQYTALLFTGRCTQAGISVSMGSVEECFDNAVCESFHASLKKALIHRRPWPTRAEARSAIFEYIDGGFNPRRRALHARLPLTRRLRTGSPRHLAAATPLAAVP